MKIKNTEIELGISMGYTLNTLESTERIEKVALKLLENLVNTAKKRNFKVIELVTIPPFDAQVLKGMSSEIKNRISQFETIYHLPWGEINVAAINSGIRKAAITEIESLIDLAAELEIRKVILHPGSYRRGMYNSGYYLVFEPLIKSLVKESVFEILDYLKGKGMELALENLDNEIFFKSPEEFDLFVKTGATLVLDTVHAMRSGVNPLDFLREFGNKISEIHLTDGVRGNSEHSPIGTGKAHCLKVLQEYKKICQGPVILEEQSEKNIGKSLEFLKNNRFIDL